MKMSSNRGTMVIAGFPGVGKSFVHDVVKFSASKIVLDSDSSKFAKDKFPGNYIEHIKSNLGKVSVIMVSSHAEVREALYKAAIPYFLVLPDKSLKEEYKARYIDRGSSIDFTNLITKNWDNWLEDAVNQKGCIVYTLDEGEYLFDAIKLLGLMKNA